MVGVSYLFYKLCQSSPGKVLRACRLLATLVHLGYIPLSQLTSVWEYI